MCRNIRPLFNFDPPATEDDVRAAALQYVRKISGYAHPSRANQPAFDAAVEAVAAASLALLAGLQTAAPPRQKELHAETQRRRGFSRRGAEPPKKDKKEK